MPEYLFQLGHQPHISTAEIQAVFSQLGIDVTILHEKDEWLLLETRKPIDANALMNRLGGTIKIAEQISEADNMHTTLATHIRKLQPAGKIVFSLAGGNAKGLALELKKTLKDNGRNVRYVEAKNAATILHNKLVEKQADFTIVNNSVFVTRAIQPFEEFGERDYGRPAIQSKEGMLPPKLARILVNLSGAKPDDTLLDPFCGSGTILMEATLMGFSDLVGSDISQKAVENARKNLDWTQKKFQISELVPRNSRDFRFQIFQSDIRSIDRRIKTPTIQSIITEPYLGKPLTGKESKQQLLGQARELKQLYASAFSAFAKILKPNGTVVFIMPRFRHHNEWVRVDCLNEIKKTGFSVVPLSTETDFLLYSRPKQHVGREIWKFSFLPSRAETE